MCLTALGDAVTSGRYREFFAPLPRTKLYVRLVCLHRYTYTTYVKRMQKRDLGDKDR